MWYLFHQIAHFFSMPMTWSLMFIILSIVLSVCCGLFCLITDGSLTSYLLLWSSFSWIFVLVCLILVMGLFRHFWVCSCLDFVRNCSHAYFYSIVGFIYVLLFVVLSLSDCLIFIWCSMTCWFLLPILLEPNLYGSFVISDLSFVVNLVCCLCLPCD